MLPEIVKKVLKEEINYKERYLKEHQYSLICLTNRLKHLPKDIERENKIIEETEFMINQLKEYIK